MADSNTLRILSLDGGGERGYLSLNFLKKFVQLWGIDQSTLASQFDVICGTSIGGIMGLSIAKGMTLDAMFPFFTTQGPYIFTLGDSAGITPILPPSPSIRPTSAQQLAYITSGIPFYQSSGSYINDYGAGLLETTIQSTFGSVKLSDLNTNVLIPAYQTDTDTFVLFSNCNYSNFIGQSALASDVALSTSAAPIYLPSWTFSGHTYSDGGIALNNPAQMGISLGKMLKPLATRCCVLSLGTGTNPTTGSYLQSLLSLTESDFDLVQNPNIDDNVISMLKNNITAYNLSTTNPISQLQAIIQQATGGSQESVAEALNLQATYTLDQFYYYRFQPTFDDIPSDEDVGLDNTSSTILSYYVSKANTWYSDDIANITTFLGHLTA